MEEPEFDKAWRAARRATFGQSIAKLHQMSGAAVLTLGKVMHATITKVRAAEAIINHGAKAIPERGRYKAWYSGSG